MEWTTPELMVALFFVTGLLLLARFRRQLRAVDRTSYGYIASGLILLSLVALAQVYHRAGALDQLVLLGDARFYHLIITVAVLGGVSSLVYGVSSWLPLHREQVQYSESRISRHTFLKRVVQLLAVERRYRVLLRTTADYMCEHFGLSQAAVYLVSRRTLRTFLIGCGQVGWDQAALRRLIFAEPALRDGLQQLQGAATGLIEELPECVEQPTAILPVVAKGRIVSLVLLWTDRPLAAEEKTHLRLACDMIGYHLASDVDRSYVRMYHRQALVSESTTASVSVRKALKDNVVAVFGAIREHLTAEYFSLFLTDGTECRQRITVGENGTVLTEIGSSNRETAMLANLAGEIERLIILIETELRHLSSAEGLLAGSGMKSLMLLPMYEGGVLTAAVVLATRRRGAYGRRHGVVASGILPVMGRLVQQEHHEHDGRSMSSRMDRLSALAQKIAVGQPTSEIFSYTCRMLLEEIGTSVVRISTFDDTSAFLQSQGLAIQRDDSVTAPADGFIILSVCPLHEQVRQTGRPILVNRETSADRLSEIEASQVFGGSVKGALLVPVKIDDRVAAVISLAEQRTWSRRQYRSADIQFVSIVAGLMSTLMTGPVSGRRSIEDVLRRLDTDMSGRNRVKSSLTGILGSVEMLRSDRQMKPEKVSRYLGIIDKATRRLQECVLPTD
jgi:GAF domain-containing protein